MAERSGDTPRILIIADDLTGAADTAAAAARHGMSALVRLRHDAELAALATCDVLAIHTDSRSLTPDEAAARVAAAYTRLTAHVVEGTRPLLYKKIDSTLRGNPDAELAALMEAAGECRALVSPALPSQGRTTLGGRQLVDGVPLEEAPFGSEVSTSHLNRLFRTCPAACMPLSLETVHGGTDAVSATLSERDSAVFLADAQTEADLRCVAGAALAAGIRVYCGSAGLIAALVEASEWKSGEAPRRTTRPQPAGPTLIIAGSRHERTRQQIRYAESHGAAVLVPSQAFVDDAEDEISERLVHDTADRIATLAADVSAVILTTCDLAPGSLPDCIVARRLGRVAAFVLGQIPVSRLVLTGGDVAGAVCDAAGAEALWIEGEAAPGIPAGRLVGGPYDGLPVVTKAGGFGTRGAFLA